MMCISLTACKKYDRETITPDVLQVDGSTNLYGIQFLNDSLGYATGGIRNEVGYIFKTTDGGLTWTKTTVDDNFCAYSVEFMDETTGWVGCDFAHLLKTIDGGQTWNTHWFQASELAFHEEHRPGIKQIQYIGDSTLAFVSGENYEIGNIYRSDDLGSSWSFDTLNHELHSLSYLNKDVGFVAGYGYMAKTSDGGQSFKQVDFEGDYFTGVAMLSTNDVVAVGNNGGIYKSSNGGQSFETVLSPNGAFGNRRAFHRLKFVDNATGFAIGQYGLIMKTMDSGNTWTLLEMDNEEHLNDLSFTNGKVLIAANGGKILSFSAY